MTEGFLLSMAIWMAVPSFMVFLSLTLKANVNRVLNIISGIISIIALGATFFVGEFSARYTFQAIVEGLLMVWIVWNAWKWPKKDASPQISHLHSIRDRVEEESSYSEDE